MDLRKIILIFIITLAVLTSFSIVSAGLFDFGDDSGDGVVENGEFYTNVDILSSDIEFQRSPEAISNLTANATVRIDISSLEDEDIEDFKSMKDWQKMDYESIILDKIQINDTESDLTYETENVNLDSFSIDGNTVTLTIPFSIDDSSIEDINNMKNPQISLVRGNINSVRMNAIIPDSE